MSFTSKFKEYTLQCVVERAEESVAHYYILSQKSFYEEAKQKSWLGKSPRELGVVVLEGAGEPDSATDAEAQKILHAKYLKN